MKYEPYQDEFEQLERIIETVHAFESGTINTIYTIDVVAGMCQEGIKLIGQLIYECDEEEIVDWLNETKITLKEFVKSVKRPYEEIEMITRIFRFNTDKRIQRKLSSDDMDSVYLTSVEHLNLDKLDSNYLFDY